MKIRISYILLRKYRKKVQSMNKETFDLVEKIFTFLKVEDFNKLKNFLTAIEKDYLNYYKIFENFKEKRRRLYLGRFSKRNSPSNRNSPLINDRLDRNYET